MYKLEKGVLVKQESKKTDDASTIKEFDKKIGKLETLLKKSDAKNAELESAIEEKDAKNAELESAIEELKAQIK